MLECNGLSAFPLISISCDASRFAYCSSPCAARAVVDHIDRFNVRAVRRPVVRVFHYYITIYYPRSTMRGSVVQLQCPMCLTEETCNRIDDGRADEALGACFRDPCIICEHRCRWRYGSWRPLQRQQQPAAPRRRHSTGGSGRGGARDQSGGSSAPRKVRIACMLLPGLSAGVASLLQPSIQQAPISIILSSYFVVSLSPLSDLIPRAAYVCSTEVEGWGGGGGEGEAGCKLRCGDPRRLHVSAWYAERRTLPPPRSCCGHCGHWMTVQNTATAAGAAGARGDDFSRRTP